MNSKHWGYGHRRLVQCALGDINAVVDVDISRGTVLSFALIIMDGQGLDRANNSYDEDNDTEQHLDCKRKRSAGLGLMPGDIKRSLRLDVRMLIQENLCFTVYISVLMALISIRRVERD